MLLVRPVLLCCCQRTERVLQHDTSCRNFHSSLLRQDAKGEGEAYCEQVAATATLVIAGVLGLYDERHLHTKHLTLHTYSPTVTLALTCPLSPVQLLQCIRMQPGSSFCICVHNHCLTVLCDMRQQYKPIHCCNFLMLWQDC